MVAVHPVIFRGAHSCKLLQFIYPAVFTPVQCKVCWRECGQGEMLLAKKGKRNKQNQFKNGKIVKKFSKRACVQTAGANVKKTIEYYYVALHSHTSLMLDCWM